MKKAVKNHLVLVALLVTMVNYAANITTLNNDDDSKKTVLTLENVKEGQQLLIKDNNQIILYKENISKSGDYKKGFDLTSLPDGEYFFELNKETVIEVIPFSVINNIVDFKKTKKTRIFKPHVETRNNTVYVTALSLNASPVNITIFYDNVGSKETIYNETIKDTMDIQKAFALDATKKGKYIFLFKTENRTFSNYIKL
ncbi:hypothetical protein [Lacinutrix sp. 5H-3-7-4]|uniref:hypothetical protein n=1 Tax=Lacinutrix sp. (strain 5H-3-7-4) TaxID=983544 RepID=UPI00020A3A5A|nr:hypothetical protein [Lacinutrix sp. 5H-3-7-4]AEH00978.1 hypothetical protein Lacal_1130 [Lacinutrix sp. 5H-3-7-4]